MPPALPMLLAAALVPVLPLPARRIVCVLAPAAAFLALQLLPEGESWTATFLGFPLIFARVDALSRVFGLVFLAVAAAANLYGWHRSGRTEQTVGLLYAAGGLAVVFAGDLLTMMVAWEVMAVSSAILIFTSQGEASLRAGQRYLMVHLGAGGLLLLGVLLVIQTTGSAEFGRLAGLGLGSSLVLFSLCINAAVPPLHAWLPDAYPQASVSGSVFLSAFTTKAAVYCLIRAFAGSEFLVWAGAIMAVYGVVFAVIENNIRRLLAYHIVSQVGYMVCGTGIGTPLALDGAAAHAFCHILYKGLLFMGAGAVLYTTGRDKLSELGGLVRTMPVTLTLYMVGALSIAGAPLFNGFISKAMVVTAAGEDGRGLVVMLLNLASVGTFLSVALKLPYFAWFGEPVTGRLRSGEAPAHMQWAMGSLAALCLLLGLLPGWLYARLPFQPVDYHPYTIAHVLDVLLVMTFTGIAFWQLRDRLRPHAGLNLDTDWLYRRAADWLVKGVSAPLDLATARLGQVIATLVERGSGLTRNPPLAWRGLAGFEADTVPVRYDARPIEGLPWYDENRQRLPVARGIVWVLAVLAALAFAFSFLLLRC
jgi:multicomponent Na+:H+ antiporter subunit D